MGLAEANGISSEIIPRIATPFAGGIGRRGSVCGALVGAVMSLGIEYGRDKVGDQSEYKLCIARTSECFDRFKKEFGHISCRALIQCDISTQEGRRKYGELGVKERKCMRYVEGAVRIAADLMKHDSTDSRVCQQRR